MADITPTNLRAQAQNCRELAMGTTDPVILDLLLAMANDFDEEAEHLEQTNQMPPPTQT